MVSRFRLFDAFMLRCFRALGRASPRRAGVVLLSSGGIGDTILFSEALPRFLALAEPGEHVVLVTQQASRAVAFLLPKEIEHLPVDYVKFRRNQLYRARIGWRLFRLNARLAVATDHLRHPLVDDAMILYTDAARRIGFTPKTWPKYDALLQRNLAFYTRIVPITQAPMHRFVRWMHLAAELTASPFEVPAIGCNSRRGDARRLVVIHPFSSTRARQPSSGFFADLVKRIPPDYEIVLSAAPDDLAKNSDFSELAHNSRVRLNIDTLEGKAGILAEASLVVTVDTSVLHLAAVRSVPTICVASAAHVIDSVPYDARMNAGNIKFLVADVPCAGCLGNCIYPLVDGRYPCLEQIVPTVGPAVDRALA